MGQVFDFFTLPHRVFTSSGNTEVGYGDTILVINKSSGAATTVTLPNGTHLFPGHVVTIVDGKGDAATNNITVDGYSAQTINAAANYVIATNYAAVEFTWNGTEWNVSATSNPSSGADPTFDVLTANAIAAGDSSLGVSGQAAAQGGAIALVGGTSSTSGNAGGAITLVGGTPGATGVGGAISVTGGAGGATSGTGGAASVVGGAGTGVTTTGGAVSVTGGAGGAGATTSAGGVGGAVAITSGAGGAKAGTGAAAGGAAGALTITGGVGGATASSGSDAGGAGGALTITSGTGGAASAGTGNGGAAGTLAIAGGVGGTSAGGTGGAGGSITITGGAGAASNGAGGSVTIAGGAPNGTGLRGTVTATGLRTTSVTAGAITGATTLIRADSGGVFSVSQAAAYDIDLPAPVGAGERYTFYLTGAAANNVTITVAGSAATFVGTIVNDVTSVLPATGNTLTFASGVAALGDNIEAISISTTLYLIRAVCSADGGITIA